MVSPENTILVDSTITPLSNFTSLAPLDQKDSLFIPFGYSFQVIAQRGDTMSDGNTFPPNFDFTGFVPLNGSSTNGYLSINSEYLPGGVSIMDVNFDSTTIRWSKSNASAIDFTPVVGTVANCSGTVTPWNTIITCEEYPTTYDFNNDSYNDTGWAIEIDPVSRTIVNNQKIWALGNFAHENIVVHANQRTAYQGADSSPGYLFKFVADAAQNLHSGKLYVYVGSKGGSGNWLLLNNTTKAERNSTMTQAASLGATSFAGIEDVEISPKDGKIYFAVKGESTVYRFEDSDPLTGTTVSNFETFVGGSTQTYDLNTSSGIINEPWGTGNDNLAFDNEGNLWVLQDGSRNYVWLVDTSHTQANPSVKIFMRPPTGSEPTGLTFSPDNKFMFMSIQHPSGANNSSFQQDVNNLNVTFERDVSLIIARNETWKIKPCQANLSLNTSPISSGTYQSSHEIQAYGEIENPSKVFLKANTYIILNQGFSVQAGATFLGHIGGCQNN
ncbi:twin-arginine translocation pathway signal protein [Arcticibacterium luteifluviistationis]|uniref:Twin-arginine translocation pathway signal protein n=2 Tax=Arcticibacterium luteifluviistationis TaxID=1784714 RepID=A0A2Z4GAA0_9BACT|nr:twin-arginine translocation pathway signal protein [Arcticibacterium luteifluviistationis]